MKFGIDIFGPTAPKCGLDTEVEFTSLYGITCALSLRRCNQSVYVSSDSADSIRATRQNSRHLNLVLLCRAGDGGCGTIIIHPQTSKLNRIRATKAAAFLAHELGYPITIKQAAAEDGTIEILRPYKAFVWLLQLIPNSSPFSSGHALASAVKYAYDIQGQSTRCAG